MQSNQAKNQIAAFYEEHQKRGKYDYLYGDEARKDLFVRLIGQGRSVLEVGCRAGNLTQHYAQGNQVVGCDVDRNALKLFEERLGLKGIWLDADQEPLPFPDASFDVVVLAEVMEHLRFPARALREIARVLKADGRLVGSVPNAFRFRNRLRFLFGKPYELDPSHLRSYSVTLVRKQLEPYFNNIEILPVGGHLIGGGRTGIPVFPWLPDRIKAFFALDLIFTGNPLPTAPLDAVSRRE
ncbi:MAG TPA: class I SAM-dependent methyltransferase [Verrucomicrobiae bacterium]|nr:class I SAM-dependent methyltransferase [Verrucomicrobiae bacterium]